MGCYLCLTGASMMPGSGDVPFVICTPPKDDKFLNGGLDFFHQRRQQNFDPSEKFFKGGDKE